MQMQGGFNAHQYEPRQGGGVHPVGRFPAKISHTEIKSNKENTGGYFQVDFETPAGIIPIRYNLWNQGENSAKTTEIANGQLSALCHATSRYQLNWTDEGAALRGAQCMIEVGFQRGHEPSSEKPNGGYTEIKKVFDMAGNEPTSQKPNQTQQAQQQTQQSSAPMTSNNNGGWNNNNQQQQQQPSNDQQNNSGGGWNNNTNNNMQQQTQQSQQQNQGSTWSPGAQGAASNGAPWGQSR